MSLVEVALKKMQKAAGLPSQQAIAKQRAAQISSDQSGGEPRLPPGVVGEVVHNSGALRESAVAVTRMRHRTDKLVRIDRDGLRRAGLLPPEYHERAIADQYRQIKRPLIANATGRSAQKIEKGQIIMMASAMPSEGKTFTSINLALSMALEKDICVLLIDADVAKPHISHTFGVQNEPGLLDVLREQTMTVESVILPTDVPNLSIVPAGRASDTATELLASHRMEEIVDYMAASDPMQIVLIDSPPLLLTSESRALAQSVGQIVVVVRAGFTPQRAVLDAINCLGEDKSIGLILNQSMHAATAGYYYGYGGAGIAQNS